MPWRRLKHRAGLYKSLSARIFSVFPQPDPQFHPNIKEDKKMKVLAINGSPRKGGNIAQCLDVMAKEFARESARFLV